MPTFRIEYRDPKTEEIVVEYRDFEDSHDVEVRSPDGTINRHISFIPAIDWATDYAYTVADKGYHQVTLEK